MRFRLIIWFLFLLPGIQVSAQNQSFKVKYWITGDTLYPDSLPVIAGSIKVTGLVDNSDVDIAYYPARLIYRGKLPRPDTIVVTYRTLSIELNQQFRNKMPSNQERFTEEIPGYIPGTKKSISNENALNTAGNLSRGIGFGNAQDVAVNSNLNLRINGIIAGDVELLAAISDDNNPIQPEGNTQQLQDFDRVYIQMKRKDLGVTLGDFEMQRSPEDYFLNYYKKSRGIHFQQQWHRPQHTIRNSTDLAVARGRFSRNVFDGLEGNRGPYRLKGSNGEIFIIIIAGTERIFLDGKLLVRGEQNDYTIDYNSGELIFMPKVVITRFSRIIAEFQYSDRNYARSVVQNRTDYTHKNTHVYLNFFREADSRNQPFQQSLDGYDSLTGMSALDVLRSSGDAPQAYIPRVTKSKVFLSDRVMYRRNASEIFEYADRPGEDSAYYEVAFSYLGPGNGNYRQQQSGANGRVYVYVPPVNGIKQGDYDAVDVLIPPKSQGMSTIGLIQNFNRAGKLNIETALSYEDLNRYSTLGDQNNFGGAARVLWEHNGGKDTSRNWKVKKQASVEHTGASFRYVERYRDVEFNRNWNRTLQNPESTDVPQFRAAETIGDAWIRAYYKDKGLVTSRTGTFIRKDAFRGISQELGGHFHHAWFNIEGNTALLKSMGQQILNDYYRANAKMTMVKYNWQPSVYFQSENSQFETGDSLLPETFRYTLQGVSLNKEQGKKGLSLLLDAQVRLDDQVTNSKLESFSKATNFTVNLRQQLEQGDFVSFTGTYRNLAYTADSLGDENTLQARLEAGFNLFKKALGLNSFIQTGTGQEQRREFSYLQVQAGNGVYIWNDYDSNGVQTLNEFENASELDRNRADFIRIFTPVQGFIQSVQSQFNQTLRIDPGKLAGSKHWLNRFTAIGVFTLDQKVTSSPGWSMFNPLTEIKDTQLVSSTGTIRGTVFFNRSSPVFGCDYNYFSNRQKSLLVNGFEWRLRTEHQGRVRWNIDKRFSFLGEYKQGFREYRSDFFLNRSFHYGFFQVEPRVQYQYKNNFRVSLYFREMRAANSEDYGGQTFSSRELGSEIKWLQAEKGNLGAGLSWVETKFDGDASTSLGYDLLQGLQPGSNLKWSMNAERRVAEKVQLSVVYDGRRGALGTPIHIGRVMARYLF